LLKNVLSNYFGKKMRGKISQVAKGWRLVEPSFNPPGKRGGVGIRGDVEKTKEERYRNLRFAARLKGIRGA